MPQYMIEVQGLDRLKEALKEQERHIAEVRRLADEIDALVCEMNKCVTLKPEEVSP